MNPYSALNAPLPNWLYEFKMEIFHFQSGFRNIFSTTFRCDMCLVFVHNVFTWCIFYIKYDVVALRFDTQPLITIARRLRVKVILPVRKLSCIRVRLRTGKVSRFGASFLGRVSWRSEHTPKFEIYPAIITLGPMTIWFGHTCGPTKTPRCSPSVHKSSLVSRTHKRANKHSRTYGVANNCCAS